MSSSQALVSDSGGEGSWVSCLLDPNLQTPPEPGTPGNVPPGEDLALNIGWDRFEKLVLAVVQRVLGLRGVKFRRYGVEGQAQHGIDLAGREPDGSYTIIQCKDAQAFTAGLLRDAVEKFAEGRRPFDASQLIVVTSATTRPVQLAEELGRLQDEHPDLELDLWGAEQLNDYLRYHADIVARFWTRETAAVFCTGAPPPGVPAPPPDRQEQAEWILVGPLRTSSMTPMLRQADATRASSPADSAALYGQIAARLQEEGFRAHATIMRSRQLDALGEAGCHDQAAELAAQLAANALHHGDRTEPRRLSQLLDTLASQAASAKTSHPAVTRMHARLINAAVAFALDPLGDPDTLLRALHDEGSEAAGYGPLLVLMLAEDQLAARPDRLAALDGLISATITQEEQSQAPGRDDIVLRLRLLRGEYEGSERGRLLQAARRHHVPGRHAALISAREARRCCLESRAEEALEGWRDAVSDAIHAGLADTAADWLYSIRDLNVRYGPWTTELDEEHRLAQALHVTGSGRLLDRSRDAREAAMSAMVSNQPREAVLAARRWLTDAVVTGSWADEEDALSFLGDLYENNNEPLLAASYFQRAGQDKKLTDLADKVGDLRLPIGSLKGAPWWTLNARAALISAQADLLDDPTASALLADLTDLAVRGRAGELTDAPNHSLTLQATRSACALAPRGTPEQALAVLEMLAPDVPREPNHYSHTDDAHATTCADIAIAHPSLTMTAMTRLLDLAAYDVQSALKLIATGRMLAILKTPSGRERVGRQPTRGALTEDERKILRDRAVRLADQPLYLADVFRFYLQPDHPAVKARAELARDRIINRPPPQQGRAAWGTVLAIDSYLATGLGRDDQIACLNKLIDIARDPGEVSEIRQDALTGAADLATIQSADSKEVAFDASMPFVVGQKDGSHLDELTGTPHPLSWLKISMGAASLRGAGLRLSVAAAVTDGQQEWIRDQAIHMLGADDASDVHDAAAALARLPAETTQNVDVSLLAAHPYYGVRQAAAVLTVRQPARHSDTAKRLATDRDVRVRRVLAAEAARAAADSSGTLTAILETLTQDARHSVRMPAVSATGEFERR
ncbi:MAG TPA: hypothetical protein VMU94_28150 [Streptosporangiaceae bacterium]|nr:hypothetical protein [Streptosporangiaceae bacterium]